MRDDETVPEAAQADAAIPRRLAFLAEAGRVLASSLDYEKTLRSVARLAVGAVADYCVIDLVDEQGGIERVATAHRDPAREGLTAQLHRFPPDPRLPGGVPEALRSGRAVLVAEVDDRVLRSSTRDAEHLRIARGLGPRSFLAVPLVAHRRVLGAVTLVYSDSGRRFEPGDVALAEQLADRAALAIENARLYRAAEAEIEERRRAEAALRASEEMFRQIAENVRKVFWVSDPGWSRLDYVSPAYEEIWARPRGGSRLDPAAWLDAVVPEDRARVAAAGPLRARGEYDLRYRISRPDGEVRWIRDRAFPARGEGGQVLRIVGIAQDVTEEQRAEERHRLLTDANVLLAGSLDSRERLASLARLLLPALGDYCVVHLVEEEGAGILRVDAAHADPAKEKLVRRLLARPRERERDRTGIVWRALRSGKPLLVDDASEVADPGEAAGDPRHRDALRRLGPRSCVIVPLVARGRALGAISLYRSGTALRYGPGDLALLEELARLAALAVDNARLYEQARTAVEAREEVLGLVSHEMRNPLQAVLLMAERLLDSTPPDARPSRERENLEAVLDCSRQMLRLVDDLLDIAQIEAGQLRVRPVSQETGRLLATAVEMLAPLAEAAGVRLEREVPDRLPAVWADRQRVLQVLSNLVGNALRVAPRGEAVTLGVEPDGDELRFRVSDTGPGIAAEHLPSLFDRFWQAGRKARGRMGIGLAVARGIVEAHGGRIWVESGTGAGSTFHFTLPAVAVSAPSAALAGGEGERDLLVAAPRRPVRDDDRAAARARGARAAAVARRARFQAEVMGRSSPGPTSADAVAAHLREQIVNGVFLGRLHAGDRLPSIRELAQRFGLPKHATARAYAALEEEGLVERRARSGIFVAPLADPGVAAGSETATWVADMLAEACEHLIRVPILPDLIQRHTASTSLRCACVESDLDSLTALCSVAERQFGLESSRVLVQQLPPPAAGADAEPPDLPEEIRDADLLITTAFHAPALRALTRHLGKPLVAATLNPDLVEAVERHLSASVSVTIVCRDATFGERIRRLLGARHPDRLRFALVSDAAAIDRLDPSIPVLLTEAAGSRLKDPMLRRLAPRFPEFSTGFLRELAGVVVRLNLAATRR
jgi:PAS domain S-box-containing protein